MRPMDLTIVVPSYNTRELLRHCLRSIFRYTTGICYEVICVDGNSPDGSAGMVARDFPNVTLIRNRSNESYARSVNQGLLISQGRYTCLLDSDCVLIENVFAPMVKFMDEHSDVAACGPRLLNPDGTLQHHIRRFAGLGVFFLQSLNWHRVFPKSEIMAEYYATDFDFSRPQQVEAIGTTAFLMRRSTWLNSGLFDERFRWAMADIAYEYKLWRSGRKVFYTPCASIVHFGSQTANQDVLRMLREQCRAFIDFNEAYNYFGSGRVLKAMVRVGVHARYWSKVAGYYLSSDKRVIKGPGRPPKTSSSGPLPATAVGLEGHASFANSAGKIRSADNGRLAIGCSP